MKDKYKLAIADTMKHPKHGVVSNQPEREYLPGDSIRVMDRKGKIFTVEASECTETTREETLAYWREVNSQ